MTKLTIVNRALALLGEYRVTTLTYADGVSGQEQATIQKVNDQYDGSRDILLARYRWSFARAQAILTPDWQTMTTIADNGSGLVKITKVAHGLVTGDRVQNKDTARVDGPFFITRVDADNFTLDDSVYNSSITLGSFVKAPLFGNEFQYEIPSDCLRVNSVNGRKAQASRSYWTQVGNFIIVNTDSARITYTKRVTDETLFPDLFSSCLVKQLAADLAMPILGATTSRQELLQELENLDIPNARRANAIDKKQEVEQFSPSVEARLGGVIDQRYPGIETNPLYD